MRITITYGAAEGFEDAALALARRVFAHYDEAVESLVLVPVSNEDLALYLDGELIHSASQSGRLPLVADLRAAIAARGSS
jgi:predicted Rdx family selenoprotein